MPVGQRTKVASYINNAGLEFNFVTLNYTSTLEKTLPDTSILERRQHVRITAIHHIHGDLLENVTLGVSEESQLSSVLEGDEKDDLIKPRIIESMNDGRIETFKRHLQDSSVVVLFGTSIGASDKYIWELVVQWLSENSNRCIVIHRHDSSYTDQTRRIQRRKKLFISEVQNNLLSYAEVDEGDKPNLRSRIFVIHNTKRLFIPE